MDIEKTRLIDLPDRTDIETVEIPWDPARRSDRPPRESVESFHRAAAWQQNSRGAAWCWCEREMAGRSDPGAEMLNHGLRFLMQQGWGTFRLEQLDLAAGRACIHWRPRQGTSIDRQKDSPRVRATVEGWVAGLMDWTLGRRGSGIQSACHCKKGLAARNRLRILLLKPSPLSRAEAPGLPSRELPLQ